MERILATAAFLALAFSAHAHDLDADATRSVPTYAVADLESVEGEDKIAFIKRVAEVARQYTHEHGHEVCGWLAYGGRSAFSVRFFTLRSQIACSAPPFEVLPGYAASNELIHTHPEKRRLILTALDKKLRGRTTVAGANTYVVDNCRFSKTDYAKPGYLIACGKILHQNGRGTETRID